MPEMKDVTSAEAQRRRRRGSDGISTAVKYHGATMPAGIDASTQSFAEAMRIFDAKDASRYAAELFRECFNAPFPAPRDPSGLPFATPPRNWRQYVATYRWPEGSEETVGFCNWIRYRDVYLQGGMCVRKNFYRRLPRDHFRQCQQRGGVAQMMMEAAAAELTDCKAWFGYCGDAQALAVDLRAGYRTTGHKFVIVKWFAPLAEDEQSALIDSIAALGPF
jgi:hypothetical protein